MHKLTKTDFIQLLNCPQSLWLLKNKPEAYKEYEAEFSLFLQKLIREGYEVEEYVTQMFKDVKDLEQLPTNKSLSVINSPGFYSQVALETSEGVYARLDLVESLGDKVIDIYEIKSSTSIKKDKRHNHLKDIAFQKYVAQQNGLTVRDVIHVHLNKEFIKDGAITPEHLLVLENVNDAVVEIYDATCEEIKIGTDFINQDSISEHACDCLDKTSSNHCDTFRYFNRDIPTHSIYDLQRINQKKILELRELTVSDITDIPTEYKLSPYQELQQLSLQRGEPIIDKQEVKDALSKLTFPLYFFDYETLPFAVPRVNGYGPHQHTPVQFSLHILEKNGSLEHREYLAQMLEGPEKLLLKMQEYIGTTGSLVSWYASFEISKNREMKELYPEFASFLTDINNRTFDLMDPFRKDYVDAKFHGSNSIKSVLPVLVPELSYKDLEIQGGTMAVDAAERLYDMTDPNEIQEIRKAMLAYCELDTLAMVKIYQKLLEI